MPKSRYDVKGSQVLDAFHRVVETHDGDVGMPGLDLALSVRNLTDPQLQAVELLLEQFVAHPRAVTPVVYLWRAWRRTLSLIEDIREV